MQMKMEEMRSSKLWTLFVVSLLCMSCNTKSKTEAHETSGGVKLASIRLVDLYGKAVDMDEFRGKTVFINFWATWCKPCLQEMPTIERAHEQLKDKDIIFLLASNESLEQIKRFKEQRKFAFRYVRVENLEKLNIQALPTTYIFDPDGKLVFSEAGFRAWDVPENIELLTKAAEQ